jgi:hypothetical protein
MMTHIDVSRLLRQTVSCDLYSNLVTRPTGAAVRAQIQELLRDVPPAERQLAVIDFSHVRMIDFSCADEVIAKLILPYCEGVEQGTADTVAPPEAYFVFRGVTEAHWDAIDAVLERHELALVAEDAGEARLFGVLEPDERTTWEALYRIGVGGANEVARELASRPGVLPADVPPGDAAARLLERLHARRLAIRLDDGWYMAVGAGSGARGTRRG